MAAVRTTGLAVLAYGVAAGTILLSEPRGAIASIWVANALLIGILAYRGEASGWRPRLARMVLVAALLAWLNLWVGRPLATMAVMGAANIVEIELLLLLFRRERPMIADVASPPGLALFVAAAVVASAGCALGVALLVGQGTALGPTFRDWFLADALGLVIVTPLVITLRVHRGEGAGWRRVLARTAGAAAATVLPSAALFLQPNDHLLPLVFPALLLVAANFGFLGAVVGNAAFALVAAALTGWGYGPIAPDGVLAVKVLYLQFYFAAATLTTLPVAAIVARQQTLAAEARGREHRFRRIAEVIPTAIASVDREGGVQWGNSAFREWFGLDADTLPGMPLGSLLADDAVTAADALAGVLADGSAVTADWRFHTPTREAHLMRLALAPELDASGATVAWIALLLDIDASEHARDALAASETLHRLLAEHSSDMIARLDMSGRFLFASPASARLLGLPLDEIVGARPLHLIHAEDRQAVARTLLALARTSAGTTLTVRIRPPGRAILWIEAQLVVDASGPEREIVLSARDVTRRRIAEQTADKARVAMVETNRLLIMAESAASVGHWRLDAASGRMRWSESLYGMTGLPHGTGMTLEESLIGYSERERVRLRDKLERALLDGEAFSVVTRFRRADGAIRHLRLVGQPDLVRGRSAGVFGVAQDITDVAEAQADLVRARDAAEAAAAAQSAFLNMMSHEIRTPLTGVLGAVELMRGTTTLADMQRHFGKLDASAEVLSSVLTAVLDLSRLREGRVELETIDFDLTALLRTLRDAFAAQAMERGLTLELDMEPDGGSTPWVRADRARLVQVIANLTANALKFTADGGVTLRARRVGDDRWTIAISDTGPGIEPERLEAIFAPFVQADASTARLHGGSGLGLAISRGIARAMGGDIAVQSTLGKGATFTVTLPLPPGVPVAPEAPAATPALPPLRLLLADDNEINAAIIAELARRDGHAVTVVHDGAAAVAEAEALAFDAILMDVRMPRLDGPAAARAIRGGSGENVLSPIVAVTADTSVEQRDDLTAAGFDAVLAKPVDATMLRETLRRFTVTDALAKSHADALASALPPAELARLVTLFAADAPQRVAAMKAAQAAQDHRALVEAAHALRGSALGLGAERLAGLLGAAEAAGRKRRPAELEEIGPATRATYWSLRALAHGTGAPTAEPPRCASA